MYSGPTFTGPSLFSYDDDKGRRIEVKKSDDNRLLGFLRDGRKNTFSLFLEGEVHLPDNVARFLDANVPSLDIPAQSMWFRLITFILARKITKTEIIFDSHKLTADNPLYRAKRISKCYLCDAVGWRKPKIIFLYIHHQSSRSKHKLGGGDDTITFKHFFFPRCELPRLHQALSEHFKQSL